jgi:hemolysin D
MNKLHRLAAYWELLGHYHKVFSHFWQQRKSLGGGIFNEQEAEFLSPALSLQEKPVSATARLTAGLLMALVAITLLWAILGHVDIIVNATGKIIPSGRIKTIASVDIASVRALHVVEGQQVKAGDVLIELDTSASDAERDKAVGDQSDAILQAARAKALITGVDSGKLPQLPKLDALRAEAQADIPPSKWQAEQLHLESLYRDYLAKLQRIDGDIARYSQSLPLATERAHDYQELLKDHDVAHHAWLEKEQARVDLEGQLADAKNQRVALIAETKRTAYDQFTEGSRIAASSKQDALRSDSHSKLLQLTAPVDGTVQQLAVHTVGGVVPAAQPLMQIVPIEKAVEVEASLENKDVGFVQEGQAAEVKIDTFEYTKYGTVPAIVTHVSRDAVQDDRDGKDDKAEKKGLLYTIKVMLDKSTIAVDGKSMQLSPGMSVNVEIKTGDRRIIEYILSPLMQHQREAFHER